MLRMAELFIYGGAVSVGIGSFYYSTPLGFVVSGVLAISGGFIIARCKR